MIHSILWVGARSLPEFRRISTDLQTQAPVRYVTQLDDADLSLPTDLVILAQARPGLLAAEDVAAYQRAWPTTNFVSLLGSWCEGEVRTGNPIPHLPRLYAHQWPAKLLFLDEFLARPQEPSPSTYDDDGPTVVVKTRHASYGSAIATALVDIGCTTVQSERGCVQRADFVVWEVPEEFNRRNDELTMLRGCHPEANILALVTFPRHFEIRALLEAGVRRVISQPFDLRDLVNAVLCERTAKAITSAA